MSLFVLHLFDPEAFKKCKNLRVLSNLGVFKDRLSSWLCVETLDNFGGITGNIFIFRAVQLFFHIRGFEAKKISPPPKKKPGSCTTNAYGEEGSTFIHDVLMTYQKYLNSSWQPWWMTFSYDVVIIISSHTYSFKTSFTSDVTSRVIFIRWQSCRHMTWPSLVT